VIGSSKREMKAIYSTKMDKEMSDGEIPEHSMASSENYDSDEFEEEDPDDDFNLPRNHE